MILTLYHQICAAIAACIFVVLSIFAILVLIPASPFDHRHVTLGVVLLVLDAIALMVFVTELAWYAKYAAYADSLKLPLWNHHQQNAPVGPPMHTATGVHNTGTATVR